MVQLRGEEWLLYKAFPIDVVFLRGTTADTAGNVTMEREALTLDNLAMAMAARNSGGLVLVQVERVAEAGSLAAREVKLPGALVDAWWWPRPSTTGRPTPPPTSRRTPASSALPLESMPPLPLDARKVIGRRSAEELVAGSIINLGIGMPEAVAGVAREEGLLSQTDAHHRGRRRRRDARGEARLRRGGEHRGPGGPEPAVRLLRRRAGWTRPSWGWPRWTRRAT